MRRVSALSVAGEGALDDALVDVLEAGGVVALPTDTVYGIAVAARVPGATARLFAAKQRSSDVPLAVLVAGAPQVDELAEVGDRAAALMARHWPGALTLVLPRREGIGMELGEPPDTVGVRCPDHDLVRRLAGRVGPLATTSANLHGQPTPADAAGVAEQLGGALDLLVDGGRCAGEASSVVDLTGPDLRVLRSGPVEI